ncbi:hypothetical protein MRX96_029825 [Rhipicephalus microplus]
MGAAGRSRMAVTMSLALLVALLVLQMTAVLARADPEEVGGNVVEALRLLEHLDKYYSHVNRPRTWQQGQHTTGMLIAVAFPGVRGVPWPTIDVYSGACCIQRLRKSAALTDRLRVCARHHTT